MARFGRYFPPSTQLLAGDAGSDSTDANVALTPVVLVLGKPAPVVTAIRNVNVTIVPVQMATVVLPPDGYFQEAKRLGAIDYWRLDELSNASPVADSIGTNPGTYTGCTVGVAGALALGTGVQLTASAHDYITIPTPGIAPSAISVFGWFKAAATGQYHDFVTLAINHGWILRVNGATNALEWLIDLGAGYVGIGGANVLDGAWHHIGATFDGVEQSLYKDGVMVDSISRSGTITQVGETPNLYIGSKNDEWSDTSADAVAIFPTALTPTQVARLYAQRNTNLVVSGAAGTSPAPVNIVLGKPVPAFSASGSVSPAPVNLALGRPVPTVSGVGNVAPAPTVVALGRPVPVASGVGNVAPAPVIVLLGLPAPTITTDASVNVSVTPIIVALGKPVPVVAGVANVAPAPTNIALGKPVPVVAGVGNVAPAPVNVLLTAVAPSVSTSGTQNVQPAPVGVTLGPVAPSVSGAGNFAPAPVNIALGKPVPSVSGQAVVARPPVNIALSIPTPTATSVNNVPILPVTITLLPVAPVVGVQVIIVGGQGPVIVSATMGAPDIRVEAH